MTYLQNLTGSNLVCAIVIVPDEGEPYQLPAMHVPPGITVTLPNEAEDYSPLAWKYFRLGWSETNLLGENYLAVQGHELRYALTVDGQPTANFNWPENTIRDGPAMGRLGFGLILTACLVSAMIRWIVSATRGTGE